MKRLPHRYDAHLTGGPSGYALDVTRAAAFHFMAVGQLFSLSVERSTAGGTIVTCTLRRVPEPRG